MSLLDDSYDAAAQAAQAAADARAARADELYESRLSFGQAMLATILDGRDWPVIVERTESNWPRFSLTDESGEQWDFGVRFRAGQPFDTAGAGAIMLGLLVPCGSCDEPVLSNHRITSLADIAIAVERGSRHTIRVTSADGPRCASTLGT